MYNHCGPKVLPAVVHPTKCCVKHTQENFIVPEIHPIHTTTVNHKNFEHQHFFPHTQSTVNEVSNQQMNMPGPGPMGLGPANMGPMGQGPMGMGPAGHGPRPRPGCCGPRPGFHY
ncbi:CotD family spore coat protein [Bacillus sp. FSL K6-3431]|uniref:CotD family spore coat protein n=1 Tax=Bacillus sp. FSL K6-3431 TaxID=2921500 RepID=UPI0030F6B407